MDIFVDIETESHASHSLDIKEPRQLQLFDSFTIFAIDMNVKKGISEYVLLLNEFNQKCNIIQKKNIQIDMNSYNKMIFIEKC